MPPASLICAMASFSDSIEPVSEIAMVPVAECRMPQVTSVSVTARPVVLIAEVAGTSARMGEEAWSRQAPPPFPSAACGGMPTAAPVSCRLTCSPRWCSSTRYWRGQGLLKLCSARIRKIAYIAPQNSDVDFWPALQARGFGIRSTELAGRQRIDRVRRQYNQWVANQTLEDYALRFTAKSARRWSAARVANTALVRSRSWRWRRSVEHHA